MAGRMINTEKFFADQERIYGNNMGNPFPKVLEEGLKPSRMVQDRDGYLIVLRHPDSITEPMAEFSERIAQTVPAITYDPENAHTTLFVQGMQFRSSEEQLPDSALVTNLAKAIHSVKGDLSKVVIYYGGWLYNQNSALVQGYAGVDFVKLANSILTPLERELGTSLKLPWSGHITASRFLEERPPGDLEDFIKLMKEAPHLGLSRPTSLDIAYVNLREGKINVETKERFRLY